MLQCSKGKCWLNIILCPHPCVCLVRLVSLQTFSPIPRSDNVIRGSLKEHKKSWIFYFLCQLKALETLKPCLLWMSNVKQSVEEGIYSETALLLLLMLDEYVGIIAGSFSLPLSWTQCFRLYPSMLVEVESSEAKQNIKHFVGGHKKDKYLCH